MLEGALPQEVDAALDRVRLPDGAVRDGRPRRPRRRLAHPQGRAASAPRSPTRSASWGGSARRPATAISATRAARARRSPTRRSRSSSSTPRTRLGIKRRTIDAGGDPRAPGLPDDQRGRAHPRGGHRRPAGRHRRRSGSTAMAGRSGAAARCSMPTRSGSPISRDRLAAYAARSDNKALEPAPLLTRLARDGRGFAAKASEDKAA